MTYVIFLLGGDFQWATWILYELRAWVSLDFKFDLFLKMIVEQAHILAFSISILNHHSILPHLSLY